MCHNKYMLKVSGSHPSLTHQQTLLVLEVPVICPPLVRPALPASMLEEVRGMVTADEPDEQHEVQHLEIDILVGIDQYWQMESVEVRVLPGGAVAKNTKVG